LSFALWFIGRLCSFVVTRAMEKYRLIPDTSKTDYEQSSFEPHHQHHRGPLSPSSEHKFPEVRITQQGKPRNYISYAMNLFVSICCRIFLD
jgi:hypothetical protein